MNWLGKFAPGEVITDKFTTTNGSGVPSSVSGGVIRVYVGKSTAPISGGVSFVADFASNTGSNLWAVDTAADPPAYLTVAGTSGANQYTVELSSGSVAGFPVRGYQLGKFTLAYASTQAVNNVLGNVAGNVLGQVVGGVSGSITGVVSGVVGTMTGNLVGSVIGDVSGSVGFVQAPVTSTLGSGPAQDIAFRTWTTLRTAATASGTFGQGVLVTGAVPLVINVTNVTGGVAGAVGSVTGAVGSVTGDVGGNVTGKVLGGVSGGVGLQPSAIVTATIAPDALDSTVFAAGFLLGDSGSSAFYNAIADALLDRADAIETGLTPRQSWRGVAATALGLTSGAGLPEFGIWGAGVDTTRVSATTSISGNRLAVTLNL